uniref:Uncharacterized protein n=1 Tax=Castor canadensis TaxID=51338 RepID=A0A8C0WPT9_CASCN
MCIHKFSNSSLKLHPLSENPKSKLLYNLKLFECSHGTTSGKFHTMKLCFIHKIIKNIL